MYYLGFKNDGGQQSERHPTPTDCGQDHPLR